MTDRIDDPPLDDDLAARFAQLEHLAPPDIWERAVESAAVLARTERSMPRWWAAAAAVVLVVGGVVGVAVSRGGDDATHGSDARIAPVVTASEHDAGEPAPDVDQDGDLLEFGSATVEPALVAPGDFVTVTPHRVVRRTCDALGAIFDVAGGRPVLVEIIDEHGTPVQPIDCMSPKSIDPLSYTIPEGLVAGTYALCRAVEFSDEACGRLEVVAGKEASETIGVPVVEGLTEAEAVQTIRSLDLVVLVERVEVQRGDPSVGRVVSQNPPAATPLGSGSRVTIVVGSAVGDVDDELASALARFGVDLATAPAEATQLAGATLCGSEQLGLEGFSSAAVDVEGRRCLLDRHAARLPAVFISGRSTDEGDPIVVVTRTDADGTATEFVDSTRDSFGSGEWEGTECGLPKGFSDAPLAFGCADGAEALTEPLTIEPLPIPDWFVRRTVAPSCGYYSSVLDGRGDTDVDNDAVAPLACMAEAIGAGAAAELVTVHVGDDLRVARWIVFIGSNDQGTPQFEVASLLVDLRAGATRWAETRCVEGELVNGRLVGEFVVDREFVDQLDPSGTIVTESGEVLIEPGPDERGQLQPCNGPQRVERPEVTPFEATGLRVGDIGSPTERFFGLNEVGDYDVTIEPSWEPVGAAGVSGIIGFSPSSSLEFSPPPDEPQRADDSLVIYADDGVTRIGEFGDDGAVLD